MTVEKMLGLMGFHFIFFFFFIPPLVAVVVFAIRIHRRCKRNRLSVRRPLHDIRAGREFRQRVGFASFHRKQIHLRLAAARRKKRQRLSIPRPHCRTITPPLSPSQPSSSPPHHHPH